MVARTPQWRHLVVYAKKTVEHTVVPTADVSPTLNKALYTIEDATGVEDPREHAACFFVEIGDGVDELSLRVIARDRWYLIKRCGDVAG